VAHICTCVKKGKIRHILLNISEGTGPIFNKFSVLVDMRVIMIHLPLILRSLKGRCYEDQVILEANIEHKLIPPLFFCIAFHNDMEYRHLHARINSGDDSSVSYKYSGASAQ